jgi:hypothetical protein
MHKWQKGKRLQTQVLDIAEDTVAIRSLDWDRDRFDIEFACVAFPSPWAILASCHEGSDVEDFGGQSDQLRLMPHDHHG